MFYADEVPHEVLPSARSRHSFTVWYYDDEEWKDAETRRGEAAGEKVGRRRRRVPALAAVGRRDQPSRPVPLAVEDGVVAVVEA